MPLHPKPAITFDLVEVEDAVPLPSTHPKLPPGVIINGRPAEITGMSALLRDDRAALQEYANSPKSAWTGRVHHHAFPEGTPLTFHLVRADPVWGFLTEAPGEVQVSWLECLAERTGSGRAREVLSAIRDRFQKPIVAWDVGKVSEYEGEDYHPLVFWGRMLDEGLIDRAVTTEETFDYRPLRQIRHKVA